MAQVWFQARDVERIQIHVTWQASTGMLSILRLGSLNALMECPSTVQTADYPRLVPPRIKAQVALQGEHRNVLEFLRIGSPRLSMVWHSKLKDIANHRM